MKLFFECLKRRTWKLEHFLSLLNNHDAFDVSDIYDFHTWAYPVASISSRFMHGRLHGVRSGDLFFDYSSLFNHFGNFAELYQPEESNFRTVMVVYDCSVERFKQEASCHRRSHTGRRLLIWKRGIFIFHFENEVTYSTFCHMLPFWFPCAQLNY